TECRLDGIRWFLPPLNALTARLPVGHHLLFDRLTLRTGVGLQVAGYSEARAVERHAPLRRIERAEQPIGDSAIEVVELLGRSEREYRLEAEFPVAVRQLRNHGLLKLGITGIEVIMKRQL